MRSQLCPTPPHSPQGRVPPARTHSPAKLARARLSCSAGGARTLLAAILTVYVVSAVVFLWLRPPASPDWPSGLARDGPPARLRFRLVAAVPSNAAQAAVSLPLPPPASAASAASPLPRHHFAVLNYYGRTEVFAFRPHLALPGARPALAEPAPPHRNGSGARTASGDSPASSSAVERIGDAPGDASHGGAAFRLGRRAFLAVAQFTGEGLTVFETLSEGGPGPASGAGPSLCLAASAPARGATSVAALALPRLPAGTLRLAVTLYNDGRVAFFDVSLPPASSAAGDAGRRGPSAAASSGAAEPCASPLAIARLPEAQDLAVPGAVAAAGCSAFPPRASPRRVAAGSDGGPALTLLTVAAYFAAGGWEAASAVFLWDPKARAFARLQDIPTTGAHGAACFRTRRGATGLALALARDAQGGFAAESPVFKLDWRSRRFVQTARLTPSPAPSTRFSR